MRMERQRGPPIEMCLVNKYKNEKRKIK